MLIIISNLFLVRWTSDLINEKKIKIIFKGNKYFFSGNFLTSKIFFLISLGIYFAPLTSVYIFTSKSFSGLRGSYDFLAVFEGDFAQGAGIKMATEASGTLCNLTILEEINLNDVAAHAAKIAQKYKGVGQ